MRRSGRIKEAEQYKECEQCREYKKDKCDEEDKEYDVGLHVTKLPITHRAYVHIKRKLLTFFYTSSVVISFLFGEGNAVLFSIKRVVFSIEKSTS